MVVTGMAIIFGICFLIASEKIFEHTNYYRMRYAETDKFRSLKDNEKVDFVNTGSTFSFYGIDYEIANVHGINLALCPQSLEYDFKMLKHYKYRYNVGATVFIVISDLAFAKARYNELKEKYYRVLSMTEIDDFNIMSMIRAKYFPVLYHWKNFLRPFRDIQFENDYNYGVNENDREAVEADANKRCKAWMREFSFENLYDKSQSERFSDEFTYTKGVVQEMISWCMENGFRPVIVNLPTTSEMQENFSKDFLDAFYYSHINDLVSKTKVKFIDLQKKEKLSDYLLYLDSCRLNKAGREIITKVLISYNK